MCLLENSVKKFEERTRNSFIERLRRSGVKVNYAYAPGYIHLNSSNRDGFTFASTATRAVNGESSSRGDLDAGSEYCTEWHTENAHESHTRTNGDSVGGMSCRRTTSKVESTSMGW